MSFPLALDTVKDNNSGFGLWGLIIVLGLIAASIALFFFMRRSLNRIEFTEEKPSNRDT